MRCWGYIACVMFFCCIIFSCEGKKSIQPTLRFVYFNSFESAEDTTGWWGIGERMFIGDPSPEGGKRSLYIGGGCIQPTAFIILPSPIEDGYYRISCWGKVKEGSFGGVIVLAIADEGEKRPEIQLGIHNKEWTFYQSEKTLHCPANSKLRLEIWIGGFIPAYMFIDCIKIEKVK